MTYLHGLGVTLTNIIISYKFRGRILLEKFERAMLTIEIYWPVRIIWYWAFVHALIPRYL